jgi:hypothetical protein
MFVVMLGFACLFLQHAADANSKKDRASQQKIGPSYFDRSLIVPLLQSSSIVLQLKQS